MSELTNDRFLHSLKNLVAEERKITAQVLDHLREVEARKLHLQMGYPSLFEFCLRELGYSEGGAHRRISAMRLLQDVPEVKAKIESGALSLTVVAQTQSFFRQQAQKSASYAKPAKLALLTKLENVSARECERVLLKLDPEPVRRDPVRAVSDELTELRLTVGADFMQKISRLKNIFSNANPNIATPEILSLALDQLLKLRDPMAARGVSGARGESGVLTARGVLAARGAPPAHPLHSSRCPPRCLAKTQRSVRVHGPEDGAAVLLTKVPAHRPYPCLRAWRGQFAHEFTTAVRQP